MQNPPRRSTRLVLIALLPGLWLAVGCEPRDLPPLAPPIDVGPDPDSEPQPDGGPPLEPPGITPASGSMAGYFEITLDLSALPYGPDDVQAVEIGGVAGIYLRPDGDRLHLTVQGHPDPGPADVAIYTADSEQIVPDGFTYDPPRAEGIRRIVALGASISQGFQSGAPTAEGTLGSPPAWVAQQMGAWLGLPLFIDDLFPDFGREQVAAPPLCETPDVTDWLTRSVGLLVPKLSARGGGSPLSSAGRVDPNLDASHLAIAGSTVAETLRGPGGGGSTILGHLVYAVEGTVFDQIEEAPIERAEALAPDLIIALDFYGNDVLLEEPEPTDEDEQALRDEMVADIDALVVRMAATGAHVFVGDVPPTSIMPDWRLSKAVALRDADPGTEDMVAAQFDADVAIIDDRTRVANEALYAAAARFDNVHLVPTAQAVLDIVDEPLVIDGQALSWAFFGGLVGLDGVHFTDTGYAYSANLVIRRINEELDLDVPEVDLAVVLAADPESPAALRALGIPVDECLR